MKTVLIGLGMVARTHVRAIAATERKVILQGVCSRDAGKAAAFAQDVSSDLGAVPKVYASAQEIAEDPEIDFVIVATPPNARAEIVQTLSKAGKHILLEKPIERTSAAAADIVSCCETAGVKLGIVFQHRMRASSAKLSALLREGALGELAVVEILVPWWREQSYYNEPGRGTYARDGGGVLISQAIHTLDLALTFTGPVHKVQAFARTSALHKMESEDFVSAGLEFASGASGSLVASTASYPGRAESIALHCTKASVKLESGKLDVDWHDGRKESFGEETATGGGADPMAFTHEWHQKIIEGFAEAIANDSIPVASGRETLAVHRLIDALLESSRQERAITLSPAES